jgi:hypothetical protein
MQVTAYSVRSAPAARRASRRALGNTTDPSRIGQPKEAILMSNSFKYTRLSKDDAACLLVDHQSGLISLVQDFSPGEFKNNLKVARKRDTIQ